VTPRFLKKETEAEIPGGEERSAAGVRAPCLGRVVAELEPGLGEA
jgi:hypothetical protein